MRALILLISVFLGLAAPARAANDAATAQTVIRSQEEAIGRDDAGGAYSLAAPSIHMLFPDADRFLSMVHDHYAPIYRHQRFEFGVASVSDGKIEQRVYIVDADGVAWDALYMLEQQADGSLKISGCVLSKLVGA